MSSNLIVNISDFVGASQQCYRNGLIRSFLTNKCLTGNFTCENMTSEFLPFSTFKSSQVYCLNSRIKNTAKLHNTKLCSRIHTTKLYNKVRN